LPRPSSPRVSSLRPSSPRTSLLLPYRFPPPTGKGYFFSDFQRG
jgi:hypothetical protein